MLHKKLKKRFASCLATILAITCMMSSIPVQAAGGKAAPVNYAANATYTTTCDALFKDYEHPDTTWPDDGTKLIDGVVGTADWDPALVGYSVDSEKDYIFEFDLKGAKDISTVSFSGWKKYDVYIYQPKNYKIEYMDGSGTWQTFFQSPDRSDTGTGTGFYTFGHTLPSGTVSASKVRITMRPFSVGLFLDEVEILGESSTPPAPVYGNLALNAPYTKSEVYSENGTILYPDTDDKELTDGKVGGTSYGEAGWVGFAGNGDPNRFVQVDLGNPAEIDEITFSYCVSTPEGISPPSAAKAEFSLDGNTWFDFATFSNINAASGAHTISAKGASSLARYVKFTFTKVGWLFVSEVEVFGKAASIDPNLPYLALNLPSTKNLYFGNDVDLKVSAIIGTPGTVTYEWTKDGQPIEATTDTFSIKNAKSTDSGTYQVKVTNAVNGKSYVTDSIACSISVTEVQDAKTLLQVFKTKKPKIVENKVVLDDSQTSLYKVVIGGSDRDTIIDVNGNVYQPLFDTEVNLVYKAISVTDPLDYENADYNVQVTVPGKYTKSADDNEMPSTLPSIREWKGLTGNYELKETSSIVANTAVEKSVAAKMVGFFKDVLKKDITVKEGTPAVGDIQLKIDSSIPEMGKEGYYMDISDTVVIRANENVGLLYGAISTVQALYSNKYKTLIPKGIARDYPAYEVRGAFLDIARMAYPLEYLEEITKYMAWFKMNDFHLHLNDRADQNYQAFRVESTLPTLTSTDLFYTKDAYRTFQETANDWGVNIISEIETPGHAQAFKDVPGIKMIDSNHLDISDTSTVNVIKDLMSEMLDGSNPVFKGDVLHIGTDEYYAGTPEQMNNYVYDLTQHLNNKNITMRFWGAFLNNAGVPAGVKKTIPGSQCNIWASSGEWGSQALSPTQMIDYGYDLINSNGYNLYMVPGGVEYSDSLNHASLFKNWDVNHFDQAGKKTNIMPLGHPQVIGADFLIWNDRGTSNTGFSIFDTFTRFQCGTTIVAEKTWHGPADPDQTYTDFAKRDKMFKDIVGGANPTRLVNSSTQTLTRIDFEDVSGNVANDLSENNLDATVTNGSFVQENGSTVVSFNGNGFMSLPVKSIGFPYEASFDIKVSTEPTANTKLFSSEDGTFYANINGTGKVGFKRDGFKVITPGKNVQFDRTEGSTFIFDYKLPLNTWTTIKIKSDKQFSYLEAGGTTFKAKNTVDKLSYPKPNPLDESSISLFSTEQMFVNMNCMVDNFTVINPELSGGSAARDLNLAFECKVTTSPLEDGSAYGRDFCPEALTNGIKNDVNNRVAFDPNGIDRPWAIIDLGKSMDVNLIKVFFFESCPEYKIYLSNDKKNWTEVAHKTDGVHGRPNNTDEIVDFAIEKQAARYVKYEGLQKWQSQWGGYHAGLSEIEVYNKKGDFDVTITPAINGTITTDKATANKDDTVTLTVTPDGGYTVDTVTVDGAKITLTEGKYVFTMPAKNVTISATFAKIPATAYSVTVSAATNGSVSSDKQSAAEGEKVTLTVTPDSGYRLKALYYNGTAITAVNSVYSFTMPAADVTVTAEFEKIPATAYSVTVSSATNGSVSSDKQSAAEGEKVTLTVTPDSGYRLKALYYNGTAITAVNSVYSFTMPAADVTVTAEFEKIPATTYSVTVSTATNGRVSSDKQSAAEGEKVTLTVTPDSGYTIDTVTVDGTKISPTAGVYAFTMPARNVTISATFTKVSVAGKYNINIDSVRNGLIVSDKKTANKGDIVTITVYPNDDYEVDSVWCDDLEISGTRNKYVFWMPAEDVYITASFTRISSGGSSGGGTIRPTRPKPPKPVNPSNPTASTWQKVNGVWKLKGADGKYLTGWAKVNGKWYLLGADGSMKTGWAQVNGKWYLLNTDGSMKTGWAKVNGQWYLLNTDGSMKTGWAKVNGQWYFLNDSGAMATGWKWIGGKCYYFDASGKMATNTTIGGYKVNANGEWVK